MTVLSITVKSNVGGCALSNVVVFPGDAVIRPALSDGFVNFYTARVVAADDDAAVMATVTGVAQNSLFLPFNFVELAAGAGDACSKFQLNEEAIICYVQSKVRRRRVGSERDANRHGAY
jgi:hypothetical protein